GGAFPGPVPELRRVGYLAAPPRERRFGDKPSHPPPVSAGRRHQSESAQEKAAPGAGRRRAGTASDEETRTLQFTAKICGGRLLQRHPDIGCMLQRHDAIRPAVDEGPLAVSLLRCPSRASPPFIPFQSFIPLPLFL